MPVSRVALLRKGLWHFRTGGLPQLRKFLHRQGIRLPYNDDGHDYPEWVWPDSPPRRNVHAAVILDPFSTAAFAYEWRQTPLLATTWADQLEQDRPDLLFVESAWAGNDRAWQYQLVGPNSPSPQLRALVEYCKANSIPTVFWNKEDPTHWDDFINTAALFDHVFTTDVNRVDAYRERLGHDRVGVLPFAVPDRVCNPAQIPGRERDGIAFAGTWFTDKYPDRADQQRFLFDAAIRYAREPFRIFSRFLGGEARYQFPEPYNQHVAGSLPYDRMLAAYRLHDVFLNVNTVTDSPTMCARRALEIVACGTPILSTPSPALTTFMGPAALPMTASTDREADQRLHELLNNPDHRARIVHVAQRHLWNEHTYTHRTSTILTATNTPHTPTQLPTVSALVATRRPGQLHNVFANVAAQQGVNVELLIAADGFPLPENLAELAAEHKVENVHAFQAPHGAPLGECLNFLTDRASGQVVTKMDDDDWYGPNYLLDLLHALRFSGAAVVGKYARYVYLADRDEVVFAAPDNEHRYGTIIAGPTITCERETARTIRFPALNRGEDTGFLNRVHANRLPIYSADRFNFLQYRAGGRITQHQHAWTPDVDPFEHLPAAAAGHDTRYVTV